MPPRTTSAGPPVRWTATCSPRAAHDRAGAGPYAACGSPFHWDGSSSRRWRSSRSRARVTISSSCARSGPWVRRHWRRECRSTGSTPAPAGTATTSTSMGWSIAFARARRRAGRGGSTSTLPPPIRRMGGLKTTPRHYVIREHPYSSWLQREPRTLSPPSRRRTVASSTRGQGDPDAPGSGGLETVSSPGGDPRRRRLPRRPARSPPMNDEPRREPLRRTRALADRGQEPVPGWPRRVSARPSAWHAPPRSTPRSSSISPLVSPLARTKTGASTSAGPLPRRTSISLRPATDRLRSAAARRRFVAQHGDGWDERQANILAWGHEQGYERTYSSAPIRRSFRSPS